MTTDPGKPARRLWTDRPAAARTEPTAAELAPLAAEFAEWRLGGCPGYGFRDAFKVKVTKLAKRHKTSYGDVWARVHALAEVTIAADPRSRLASQSD